MEQFDKLKLQSWESADDVFDAVEPILNAFIFAQGYQDEKITALQKENEKLKTRADDARAMYEGCSVALGQAEEKRDEYRKALEWIAKYFLSPPAKIEKVAKEALEQGEGSGGPKSAEDGYIELCKEIGEAEGRLKKHVQGLLNLHHNFKDSTAFDYDSQNEILGAMQKELHIINGTQGADHDSDR